MKRSTAFWMATAFFFSGVIWGFLLAPIRNGIMPQFHNSFHHNGIAGTEDEEEKTAK